MKSVAHKFGYISAVIILAVIVIISSLASGGVRYADAAVSPYQLIFETQNVWEDLSGATIDGEKIDLKQYNFDEKKNTQIISFVEFCYSPFAAKQGDYGLYVYVYNPRGYDWTQKPAMNKIQFRYGGNSAEEYSKYALKYLNRSTAAGYEGLFYKFKIVLSDTERTSILTDLNSTERIYEVSGIELYDSGLNATEYKISATYRYSGYAKGYGAEGAEGDTLKCTSDGLTTLSLDIHPTYYRPNGSNGSDEYTQDSLHSVYFSVPNSVLNEYGGLSAIHATWLNAITAPYLVTGNKDIYNALLRYVGRDIGYNNSDVGYAIFGGYEISGLNDASRSETAKLAYNARTDNPYFVNRPGYSCNERAITILSGLFYASGGNADGYTVSSQEIKDWLLDFSEENGAVSGGIYKGGSINSGEAPSGGTGTGVDGGHGGGGFGGRSTDGALVLDKYSPALFETVDNAFTDINISADDKYTLVSEKISQSWWQKIFGGSYVEYRTVFDNIEAIHKVEERDFRSGNEELICDKLYINQKDYSDFKDFYDAATLADKTVFLFRYQSSDYKSMEATEFIYTTNIVYDKEKKDTNAYFFQETVNLDFDIIDVTLKKGDVQTVIACIASPQDIVHAATPPLNTKSDKLPWWVWLIIAVVAILAILILLFVFLPGVFEIVVNVLWKGIKYLFSGLWRLICLPFKAIASAVKKRKEKKAAEQSEQKAEKLEKKSVKNSKQKAEKTKSVKSSYKNKAANKKKPKKTVIKAKSAKSGGKDKPAADKKNKPVAASKNIKPAAAKNKAAATKAQPAKSAKAKPAAITVKPARAGSKSK